MEAVKARAKSQLGQLLLVNLQDHSNSSGQELYHVHLHTLINPITWILEPGMAGATPTRHLYHHHNRLLPNRHRLVRVGQTLLREQGKSNPTPPVVQEMNPLSAAQTSTQITIAAALAQYLWSRAITVHHILPTIINHQGVLHQIEVVQTTVPQRMVKVATATLQFPLTLFWTN